MNVDGYLPKITREGFSWFVTPDFATSLKSFQRLPDLFSSAVFPCIKAVSQKEEQFVLL